MATVMQLGWPILLPTTAAVLLDNGRYIGEGSSSLLHFGIQKMSLCSYSLIFWEAVFGMLFMATERTCLAVGSSACSELHQHRCQHLHPSKIMRYDSKKFESIKRNTLGLCNFQGNSDAAWMAYPTANHCCCSTGQWMIHRRGAFFPSSFCNTENEEAVCSELHQHRCQHQHPSKIMRCDDDNSDAVWMAYPTANHCWCSTGQWRIHRRGAFFPSSFWNTESEKTIRFGPCYS
ncbi:hypothetical protein J5N97_008003 [Dioscorea zingiberensis]|uniref:Uncharacterized protein n=1 Tax=Dioscorea zingiberensis TaxID=325984 RepID=A0A9D5DI03_9LILI|nr:hypothetical protein J5N97_008003 [Dioscorea zingiberensis]